MSETVKDELLRQLHDTMILLGAPLDVARLLLCLDLSDDASLRTVQQFNISLVESMKDKFVAIHCKEIQVGDASFSVTVKEDE